MFYARAAYGRTYSSQADAARSYERGDDFKIINGPYFSIRDFDSMRVAAEIDRAVSNENYVIKISFPLVINGEFVKHSQFYVNFKNICVLS